MDTFAELFLLQNTIMIEIKKNIKLEQVSEIDSVN